MDTKQTALDYAIKSNTGLDYDEDGNVVINHDKIIEAAKKFEAYLKDNNQNG